MQRLVTGLLLTTTLLVGCVTESKTVTFKNEKYGFTVMYPASWRVNNPPPAPPPPVGTAFYGNGATIYIVVWREQNLDEQESLRNQGWTEETITVAGEKGTVLSRPSSDTLPGLWRRVYFEHDGVTYEMSLEVTDKDRAQDGLRVFDDMMRSFDWTD